MRISGRWSTVMAMMAATLGGLAAVARAQAPAAGMVQGYTNAAIASHARQVGGQAPREQRKMCEGDVNGDGHGDIAVVYLIEGVGGGSGWTQYLIVMTSTPPQGFGSTAPKEVGATTKQRVESCTIAAGVIDAVVKEFAPSDPACCPSKPGQLRFTLEKGKLIAAPAPSKSAP